MKPHVMRAIYRRRSMWVITDGTACVVGEPDAPQVLALRRWEADHGRHAEGYVRVRGPVSAVDFLVRMLDMNRACAEERELALGHA
ncbi:MAG TPA: hypothetical protein VH092_39125 [Urbifossiella sp.]|jgi:hypothetical protein|nr:hypothetical protein [Urbifossiella sp.]